MKKHVASVIRANESVTKLNCFDFSSHCEGGQRRKKEMRVTKVRRWNIRNYIYRGVLPV
jgi:hypothetical protein